MKIKHRKLLTLVKYSKVYVLKVSEQDVYYFIRLELIPEVVDAMEMCSVSFVYDNDGGYMIIWRSLFYMYVLQHSIIHTSRFYSRSSRMHQGDAIGLFNSCWIPFLTNFRPTAHFSNFELKRERNIPTFRRTWRSPLKKGRVDDGWDWERAEVNYEGWIVS